MTSKQLCQLVSAHIRPAENPIYRTLTEPCIGGRLTQRLADVEIDEPADEALVSDLAPILAALRQSCGTALDATDPVSA